MVKYKKVRIVQFFFCLTYGKLIMPHVRHYDGDRSCIPETQFDAHNVVRASGNVLECHDTINDFGMMADAAISTCKLQKSYPMSWRHCSSRSNLLGG